MYEMNGNQGLSRTAQKCICTHFAQFADALQTFTQIPAFFLKKLWVPFPPAANVNHEEPQITGIQF